MTPATLLLALAVVGGGEPAPTTGLEAPPEEPKPNVVVPILHDAGVMVVMRTTETILWPNPFARPETFASNYEQAYTKPPRFETWRRPFEWDGDSWYLNTIGHGLFGSELYLRARQCHLGWGGSLAMAAAASTIWEYVFEANGSRPSALDLVWTPLVGGLGFGEARFQAYRLAGTISSKTGRAVVRAILDPLGDAERALGTGC
jgi:hypothetical protein